MSYLKTLKALAPTATEVEQFKSCQCGWAWYGSAAIIYSYTTIVGVVLDGVHYLTTEKYSSTTTQQLNKMAKYFHYPRENTDTDDILSKATWIIATAQIVNG